MLIPQPSGQKRTRFGLVRGEFQFLLNLTFVLGLILLASCAAKPQKIGAEADSEGSLPGAFSSSQLEISYVRGQNQHRFLMRGGDEGAIAKCYLDNQLLRETTIELPKYADLFKRASDLISTVQHRSQVTEPLPPCRTPFTISLKTAGLIQKVDGCRSAQDGASLGKLIRDAEFAVFSAKAPKRIP